VPSPRRSSPRLCAGATTVTASRSTSVLHLFAPGILAFPAPSRRAGIVSSATHRSDSVTDRLSPSLAAIRADLRNLFTDEQIVSPCVIRTPDNQSRLIDRFLNEQYYRNDSRTILSLFMIIIRKYVMKCVTYHKNYKK